MYGSFHQIIEGRGKKENKRIKIGLLCLFKVLLLGFDSKGIRYFATEKEKMILFVKSIDSDGTCCCFFYDSVAKWMLISEEQPKKLFGRNEFRARDLFQRLKRKQDIPREVQTD